MAVKRNRSPKAVALQYNKNRDSAPRVSAKGQKEVAERIVQIAKQEGIPIQEDPELIEVLSNVPIGEEIPPELYQAVAEILAFVYRLSLKDRR